MATGLRLEQRLGQSLVMTPQLQQAIKLLQLSNLELQDYVEQELEKNPLLEAAQVDGESQEPTADAPFEADDAADGDPEPVSDSAELATSDKMASENAAPLDADYENVYDADRPAAPAPANGDAVAYGAGGRSDFESMDSMESAVTRPKSLREHIEEQMAVATADASERMIAFPAHHWGHVDWRLLWKFPRLSPIWFRTPSS